MRTTDKRKSDRTFADQRQGHDVIKFFLDNGYRELFLKQENDKRVLLKLSEQRS